MANNIGYGTSEYESLVCASTNSPSSTCTNTWLSGSAIERNTDWYYSGTPSAEKWIVGKGTGAITSFSSYESAWNTGGSDFNEDPKLQFTGTSALFGPSDPNAIYGGVAQLSVPSGPDLTPWIKDTSSCTFLPFHYCGTAPDLGGWNQQT